MSYAPVMLRPKSVRGVPGALITGYAPRLLYDLTERAWMCPSCVPASTASAMWSRPCGVERALPERVSIHLTGRPSSRAIQSISGPSAKM